jgi:hypothetical protein
VKREQKRFLHVTIRRAGIALKTDFFVSLIFQIQKKNRSSLSKTKEIAPSKQVVDEINEA